MRKFFVFFYLILLSNPYAYGQVNPLGAAQSSAVQNYILNGGFENARHGWVMYKNTAQALPVSGSGGTATSTLTTSTSAPIAGKASGLLTHPASNVQGEGASYAFQIDKDARGTSMQITGSYEIVSGTYNGGTGLPTITDSDVEVYVYDVDAGAVIQPSGYRLDGGVAGVTYQIQATFQPQNLTSVNYRLIFHEATTSTNAFVLRLDSIKVTRMVRTYATPITDLVSAGVNIITGTTSAPTKGTVSNDIVRFKRIGDHAQIKGEYKQTAAGSSAAGSGDYLIQLPAGLSFDPNKTTFYTTVIGNNAIQPFPAALGTVSFTYGTSNLAVGQIIPYDATHFRIVLLSLGSANNSTGNTGAFGSAYFGLNNAAYTFTYDFMAPILGWGSSTQTSDSADTRVVAARIGFTANAAVSANTALAFPNTVFDTHGGWTGSQYRVPVPGIYEVTFTGAVGSGSANSSATALIAKNGVIDSYVALFTASQFATGSALINVVAGDLLDARVDTAITLGGASKIMIKRLSGPSQLVQSDSVAARYVTSNGQSVANTGSLLTGFAKDYDLTGSFNTSTSTYTVPIPGKYAIEGFAYMTGSGVTSGGAHPSFAVFKAGTNISNAEGSAYVNAGENFAVSYSDTLNFIAGDQIQFYLFQQNGTSRTLGLARFAIRRVGN